MADTRRSLVDSRDLAEAIPGGVAIQVGEELSFVSEELASTVGAPADGLAGGSWRALFGPAEAERLERGIEQARTDGKWEGEIALDGHRADEAAIELTLSSTEDGALVWVTSVPEHAPGDGGGPATETEPTLVDTPEFVRELLDVVDDVVYVLDESGESYLWNEALVETTGYSHEEIDAMHPMELIPEDQHEYVPGLMEAIAGIEDRRVDVDILTKDGERITHEFSGTTFEDPRTGEQFRCGIARDVTDRLERERALERQRDDLAALDHINELLLETAREAIQSGSRDAVEETVCERLAASDLYRFAWVGEREYDGSRIVPRTSAGDDRGYLEEVTITIDRSETGLGPVGRAVQTGEVQVVDATDPSFEPWRDAAVERGFDSVAAIPLHDDESVYGVLVVHATREDAFSLREQAGFDVLGRTVGAVIHAARSRELLFADAFVELEFDVADADSAFVRTALDLDCELTLEGYVASGERWVVYVAVDGGSPETVIEAVSSEWSIDRARVVSEGDDGGRVELVVEESSLLDTVAAAGATLRTATVAIDRARLIVEAPVDAEVRAVVDHIRAEYPEADLLAHRERDREVTTVGRPGGPLAALTERQREVLETAYRAGYFAWPRESTAEEVAGSLDLAAPTLHGHLRKAEEVILSTLLDAG